MFGIDDLFSAVTNAVPFVGPLFGGRRDDSARRYQLQYEQSLDFWNRQNAYNHPAAQMRRFREAGLNPHLIYGQTNMAGPIATAPVPEGNGEKPDYLEGLFKYQSLRNGEAQHELIEAQKDFAVEQAANSVFNRELASKNYILSAENQEMNRGLIASQILLNNARAEALKNPNGNSSPGFLESVSKPLASAVGGLAGAAGLKKVYDVIKDRFSPDVVSVDKNGKKSTAKLASKVVKKAGKSAIPGILGKAGRFLGKQVIKRVWWPFAVASMFVDY